MPSPDPCFPGTQPSPRESQPSAGRIVPSAAEIQGKLPEIQRALLKLECSLPKSEAPLPKVRARRPGSNLRGASQMASSLHAKELRAFQRRSQRRRSDTPSGICLEIGRELAFYFNLQNDEPQPANRSVGCAALGPERCWSVRRSDSATARDHRATTRGAGDRHDLASAHNMASVLYLRVKLYSTAEWHARQALAMHADDSAKGHEAFGAFNLIMARILASRFEFDAAVEFGRKAIAEYARWHDPPDDFLNHVSDEVEAMRDHTWAPLE
jgi:hypothetical protein